MADKTLSDFRTHIKSISETAHHIDTLKTYRQHIDEVNGVCQEDARTIESLQPGFLNERRIEKQFTQFKSKVFFNDTLKYLDTSIAVENEVLNQAIATLFTYPLTDYVSYSNDIIQNAQELIFHNPTLSKQYLDSPHAVVAIDGGFQNILTTPLQQLQTTISVQRGAAFVEGFQKSHDLIVELLNHRGFAQFVEAVLEGRKVTGIMYDLATTTFNERVTYADLIAFYHSPYLKTAFEAITAVVQEAQTVMTEIEAKAKEPGLDPVAFVHEEQKKMDRATDALEYAEMVGRKVSLLTNYLGITFQFFEALL